MSPPHWLLRRLRWPTLPEWALGALVLALALHRAPAPAPVRVVSVRVDTVTLAAVAKQEPPAAPSLLHRAAYRDVHPTRVAVAPGAGRELLAAVCDTVRTVRDSAQMAQPVSHSLPDMPPPGIPRPGDKENHPQSEDKPSPALAYAGTVTQPWTPWGRVRVKLFAVSRQGESITTVKVHLPAEWRMSPEPVVREARGWRRALKPVPFTVGVFAAGWVAHSFASQF